MALTPWIDISLDYQYDQIFSIGAYLVVLVTAIILMAMIQVKIRKSNIQSNAFTSFNLLFIAIIFLAIDYTLVRIGKFLGGYIMPEDIISLASTISFTLIMFGLNLFLLRLINFREGMRKTIIGITIFEIVAMILLIATFITNIFLPEVATILNMFIAIYGGILDLLILVSIIIMFVEARNAANKMVKLRLSLTGAGTIGVLLSSFSTVFSAVLPLIGVSDQIFYVYDSFVLPFMQFIFLYVFIFGFYHSLFTPMWILKRSGVLPPSFSELMNKQKELKDSRSVS